MSNLPVLLAQLEGALNAVEPRVLEDFHPGLTDAEMDAHMARFNYVLPDDLRALYRWRNGQKQGASFLGSLWRMTPLGDESSLWIREIWSENCALLDETVPPFVEELEWTYLFDDGCGSHFVAGCAPDARVPCAIYNCDKGAWNFEKMFEGIEPMLQTALQWWRSGVFWGCEHRYGWHLDSNSTKRLEIARRLNPACPYWFGDAFG